MNQISLTSTQGKSLKRIGIGLSAGSLPLLERLKARNHIYKISLTSNSADHINKIPKGILIQKSFEVLSQYWDEIDGFIFVGALGAVVRLIAPLVKSKVDDPSIVVIDAKGSYVVPLIGGHQSGADQLALEISADLGSSPVFTSDSKVNMRLALDSFGKGWGFVRSGELDNWKKLMIKQSTGLRCTFFQSSNLSLLHEKLFSLNNLIEINSTEKKDIDLFIGPESGHSCAWHPAIIWIGIGCERNVSEKLIIRAIDSVFESLGLHKSSIAGLSTIDKKADEISLIKVSNSNQWPLTFYKAEQLAEVDVPSPSNIVKEVMGTASVAEAAAILSAGEEGKLLLSKKIFHPENDEQGSVTIAISKARKPFAPNRGELHLVGSGPGQIEFLTNDARSALTRCVAWAGYTPYLDLLEPLRRHDQVRCESALTLEKDRCQYALELAKQGIRVALISSGDSGIYGMAGLAMQFWLRESAEARPFFQVHPGISALQMAAAKLGAPLMNDFCAISLSDLLTPWEVIKKRIHCAAKGDFVIAIYNPRSMNRDWQLNEAINVLLEYRFPTTPVAVARQLGRPEEEVSLYDLNSIPFKNIDMLSIVLIGNSKSFKSDSFFVTPRGYLSSSN